MIERTYKQYKEGNNENIASRTDLENYINNAEKEDANEDVDRCKVCSSDTIESGYEVNLCKNCRDKLINRKIPKAIKIVAILVGIIMIFSFIKLPTSINSGKIYYQGIDQYTSKDYSNAINSFMKLRGRYPASNEITGWLALTYFVDRKFDKANEEFKKLPKENRGLSSKLYIELYNVSRNYK